MRHCRFLVFFIVLFVCAITFAGCSRTEAFLNDLPNGSREFGLTIVLNRNTLKNAGYTETRILALMGDIKLELDKQAGLVRDKLSAIKTKNAVEINAEPSVTVENSAAAIVLLYKVSFKTVDEYNKYYGYSADGSEIVTPAVSKPSAQSVQNDIKTQKNFFAVKYTIKSRTLYYGSALNSELAAIKIVLQGQSKYPEFKEKDVDKYYVRTTTDTKLKSNASKTERSFSQARHIWKIEDGQEDMEIEFYKTVANPIGWYVLAFGLTALFMGGYVIWAKKRG